MARPTVPYCGVAPVPADLMERWNLDPVLLGALCLAAFIAWRRAAPALRSRMAAIGALLLLLYVSPLCALSSALFSVRVLHHILLITAVAPLLVGTCPWRTSGRFVALWTLLQAAALWLWHAPAPYAAALSSTPVYWLMQASLLGCAVGFWAAVRAAGPSRALGALVGTLAQMSVLGALITFAGRPLYAPHLTTTAAWGLSPLDDQQLAGLVMWVPAGAVYVAAALRIVRRLTVQTAASSAAPVAPARFS